MPEPMKIAWLTQHLWPRNVGGVELRAEALSREMVRQGCQVEIWTTGLGEGRVETTADGRKIVGLGRPRVPAALWALAPLWRLGHALRRLSARGGVDAVFCPDCVLLCAYLAAGAPAPIIYCPGGTVHGSRRWNYPPVPGKGLRGWFRSKWGPVHQLLLAERVALARAAGVIAVSQSIRRQMATIHHGLGRKLRVVYSGGDFAFAAPIEGELPPPLPGGLTALAVARLDRIKNLAHLLRAWALVQWRPRRLWIAGHGPRMAALRALTDELALGDSVTFLGERLDTRPLLQAADVFVLPSLYEACPLALLEAMTESKPAITLASMPGVSDVAASGELNIDGETGFVVDPLEPAALAARLDLLAGDVDLRRRLGEAAGRRAGQHFTWSRAAKGYLALAGEAAGDRVWRTGLPRSWGLANA